MSQHFDIAIIGSGLVGCATAIALAKNSQKKILLIDAKKNQLIERNNVLDTRTLALNYASCQFLSALGLWPLLEPHACAIESIHISERAAFGHCILDAKDVGFNYLGQVIEIADLQQQLLEAIHYYSQISFWDSTTVSDVTQQNQQHQLLLQRNNETSSIHCDYVILADGTDSKLRTRYGIQTIEHDYQQHAIVTVAQLDKPHHSKAYERFAQDKIVAILPMTQNRVGTVLTCPETFTRELLSFDDQSYIAYLEELLGYRLHFTALGPRQSYPLKMRIADRFIQNHIVLLGNTAHTLNPVGAQGLNLGLAGIKDFIHTYLNTPSELASFETRQLARVNRLKKFTNQTVELFASDAFATQFARRTALIGLNLLPGVKQKFIRQMMGF